ncbi:hypothetical protein FPSE_00896 [Fusarium pseudograminearum CS3096]|uniref:Uncharacterized protein n=1 Tax=Fusarium pseudograminearum (strain CS3096) TaxID=1028729 RepID=K3VTV9_FUSPC|nr:hypothetical protein FPSE_00896 [Fusarium pseudograminearum CS3096]EKJ78929.1 hypothetical protein FPSE_00896 [Fusarium pseudograminearum CS3096]
MDLLHTPQCFPFLLLPLPILSRADLQSMPATLMRPGDTRYEVICALGSSPRKRGQPAFVTINKTIGKGEPKVSFDFKDNVGQLATSEFIEWEDSLGVESLKAKAMVQHDMHEQKRIRNFNTELIIRSARNYIVEVVKAGTPQPAAPRVPHLVLPELRRPTSTLELFKQIHAENAHIIAFAESLSHSEAT